MSDLESIPNDRSLTSLIGVLATMLDGRSATLSAGDIAQLRRMSPERPAAPFFKLAGGLLEEELPKSQDRREDAESRWAAIVLGLSVLDGRHRSGRGLGSALAESGYSEFRFARLLRGDLTFLLDELPAVARLLAAKDVATDWSTAAWLILSAGRVDEERARRAIARDYFARLAGSNSTTT